MSQRKSLAAIAKKAAKASGSDTPPVIRAAPPSVPGVRLLDKAEILAITSVSFVTVWQWMRRGQFPRCRVIGRGNNSKSVWRSDEIDAWLAGLKVRRLKGDAEPAASRNPEEVV